MKRHFTKSMLVALLSVSLVSNSFCFWGSLKSKVASAARFAKTNTWGVAKKHPKATLVLTALSAVAAGYAFRKQITSFLKKIKNIQYLNMAKRCGERVFNFFKKEEEEGDPVEGVSGSDDSDSDFEDMEEEDAPAVPTAEGDEEAVSEENGSAEENTGE